MMMKAVTCYRVTDKRKKWAVFEQLHETNDVLDEAICILVDLRKLIEQLPGKLTISIEKAAKFVETVMILDSSLDNCIEAAGLYFEEIEMKLDEMQHSLLHDEVSKMSNYSKLVTEIRYTQKQIDALISNAEAEIYIFLEAEGLNVNMKTTEARIMEFVYL